jgi:hypothetical protein
MFFLKICSFHVLHCSDCLHLFGLESATIAIKAASFGMLILNPLHETAVYAVPTHDYLDTMS